MPYHTEGSRPDHWGNPAEPSDSLARADLALLLSAERRLARALARPAEVLRFFLLAVEEAATLLDVDRAVLCLVDADDPSLLRVMAGAGPMAEEEGELLPMEGSFEGLVFRSAMAVRSPDLRREPGVYRPAGVPRRAGPAVAVPLRARDQPIGVLLAARAEDGAPFLDRDVDLLLELATPIGAALESMRQYDSTRRSRESVDSWSRERQLRRWITRYEALNATRVELVFRLDEGGRLEWGGSTTPIFGLEPEAFAPTIEEFLAWVTTADGPGVRRALVSLAMPDGPRSVSARCALILGEGIELPARLEGWRIEGAETLGLVSALRHDGHPTSTAPDGYDLEEMIRSIRHQINNPLAAVMGRAQLMMREDIVLREPMLRQSVETILYESDRINRFVRDLHQTDSLNRLMDPLPGETPDPEW